MLHPPLDAGESGGEITKPRQELNRIAKCESPVLLGGVVSTVVNEVYKVDYIRTFCTGEPNAGRSGVRRRSGA